MRATSTAAMAQAIQCCLMRSERISRVFAGSSFESRSPLMRYFGSSMTAPATTGPKRAPCPTSSTPATSCAPPVQSSRSNLVVHFSRFSKRNFSADFDSCFSFPALFLEGTAVGRILSAILDRRCWSVCKFGCVGLPSGLRTLAEQQRANLLPVVHPQEPCFAHVVRRREQDAHAGKVIEIADAVVDHDVGIDDALVAAVHDVANIDKGKVLF